MCVCRHYSLHKCSRGYLLACLAACERSNELCHQGAFAAGGAIRALSCPRGLFFRQAGCQERKI
jgi:hypothetical protein